jgi:CRISPR-associated protein Csx3
MVPLFPAVMIGGPPNMGKSVLTYSLTQRLREQHIDHYVIRAHPDGDGDWFQETEPEQLRQLRFRGQWTGEFVKYICTCLDRRHLPLLVDVGGLPTKEQARIFGYCTHSLLLLPTNDAQSVEFWCRTAEVNGLLPLARLCSQLDGISEITAEVPVIEGTLAGLQRRTAASGPLFDLLVARLVSLFDYDPTELRRVHLNLAPVELVADLGTFLQAWMPETRKWTPEMILQLLAELPSDTPLAVYGRAPGWLYAALVTHTGREPFYQFDARLGWVTPPAVNIGTQLPLEMQLWMHPYEHVTVLEMNIPSKYLDYTQAQYLCFPPVSPDRGLILSGAIPHWLLTALVRLYNEEGVAWIACYQPPLGSTVVVASHTRTHIPGDVTSMLTS